MRGRGREGSSTSVAYHRSAEIYDLVHSKKPYGKEAAAIRALVHRGAPRPYRTLLDVACGSGRHLEHFRRWFDCVGVDASTAMLSAARARLPGVRLVRGRMESFDLHRTFDVVTCLFSAIGYVRSASDLRRTVKNLARHTAPGGAVVIEPWLTPTIFREGRLAHLIAEGNGTTVLRMNTGITRRSRSRMDFHYLVGRPGLVEHFVEVHDLGLFGVRTMKAAFRDAGLSVHYVAGGLATGRGLYLGRKPARAAPGPLRRGRHRHGQPKGPG